ncbi:MAG: hypothetical protein WC614_07995 [bacterium]
MKKRKNTTPLKHKITQKFNHSTQRKIKLIVTDNKQKMESTEKRTECTEPRGLDTNPSIDKLWIAISPGKDSGQSSRGGISLSLNNLSLTNVRACK